MSTPELHDTSHHVIFKTGSLSLELSLSSYLELSLSLSLSLSKQQQTKNKKQLLTSQKNRKKEQERKKLRGQNSEYETQRMSSSAPELHYTSHCVIFKTGYAPQFRPQQARDWFLNSYTAIPCTPNRCILDSLHSFCHAFYKNAIDQLAQNLLCFRKFASGPV